MSLELSLTNGMGLSGSGYTPSAQAISNFANTTVTDLGSDVYLVQKTSASAWDGAVKGDHVMPGDFEIWWKHTDNNDVGNSVDVMIGADSAQVSTSGFADMDFAVNADSASWTLYENGASTGTSGTWGSTTNWRLVKRVGSTLKVYESATRDFASATLEGTFPTASSVPLWVKGVVHTLNAYIRINAVG